MREKCTSCGDVCPTGAIRPFTWQDKRYKLKMGLANVNRSTCVAWDGGRDCIVCRGLPLSAVIFKDTFNNTLPVDPTLPITAKLPNGKENKGRIKRVPTVDEKLCTGCGLCEYHCPVLPVTPSSSIRSRRIAENRTNRTTRAGLSSRMRARWTDFAEGLGGA